MTRDDIQAAITDAQQRSVTAYLNRQVLEQRRQQIELQARQVDQSLISLDGEIAALESLAAKFPAASDSKED